MYAKLINNELVYAPRKIVHNNILYNPATDDVLVAEGYKPVTYTDAPEEAEGFHNESFWEDTGAEIIQRWKAVEDTPPQKVAKLEAELGTSGTTLDDVIKFLEWLLECKNQSDFFKKLKSIQSETSSANILARRKEIRADIEKYKNGKV